MTNLPKVLIVEDSPIWHEDFAKDLEGKVELIAAYTIPQAKQYVNEYAGKLAAIGVSSMSDGAECASESFVYACKLSFPDLLIISITNHPIFQGVLLSAGCACACLKEDFPAKLYEILNLAKM